MMVNGRNGLFLPHQGLSVGDILYVVEAVKDMFVLLGSFFLVFLFFSLSFTLFKSQQGWDPCSMLDSRGANNKSVTQILITQSLWERMARGNRCHYYSSFSFQHAALASAN